MHKLFKLTAFMISLIFSPFEAFAINECKPLPGGVKVKKSSNECGQVPTVVLSGAFKNSFSAAFRWDDGSDEGQDRSPFALNNPSASSSPYKSQKRVRKLKSDFLCYGKFLNRKGYKAPVQLTIKPSAAPVVKRFCVAF